MGISYDGAKIAFEAVIYEDEVVGLRDRLNEMAPQEITFDLSSCDDLHLAVIQQILAYKKLYACSFYFAAVPKVYQKVIEGFDARDCQL